MMNWEKIGLIFRPTSKREWMLTHASLPVAVSTRDCFYRVYFSARDGQNRSHVGYVELDIRQPTEILSVSDKPVLTPGPLGRFDDHGVYAASIVEQNGTHFMYYIGWNPGARGPLFYSSIGLAVSDDGGKTFRKTSVAPILARSEHDPCLVTSPFVMIENGIWRMWYVSGFKWEEEKDGLHSYYHIKYAESKDGVEWQRNGLVCIDLQGRERNIARPCVIKEGGVYKMWYSYNKGQGYRIGYAESPDGYKWMRKDAEAGIDISPTGWDSKAMAYPGVFIHEGKKYMLYNGNEYGREGFGLAVESSAI
jgi:predicted GH43/DUF377 family glycosyl hydrolase